MKNQINFFITPRQVGKSTKQLYEFLKHKNKCLLITHNNKRVKDFVQKIRKLDKSITSNNDILVKSITDNIESIIYSDLGRNITHILIDEYLFFSIKDRLKIYDMLDYFDGHAYIDEVIIYSTPCTLYNKVLFDAARDVKTINVSNSYLSFKYLLNDLYSFTKYTDENVLLDMYCNIATDRNVNLIYTDFGISSNPLFYKRKEELKRILTADEYKKEVEGQLFEDNYNINYTW